MVKFCSENLILTKIVASRHENSCNGQILRRKQPQLSRRNSPSYTEFCPEKLILINFDQKDFRINKYNLDQNHIFRAELEVT